jgi:hypothetical protein
MRNVEDAGKAQARDQRTRDFVSRPSPTGRGARVYAVRDNGEEIYCGWTDKPQSVLDKLLNALMVWRS